uniref:Domain of unknown function DB domain-containing protein n=1 Tax=Ditylenchus dipsaci TaxID=166011 RepID=A0A915DEH3_9BILA
MRSRNSRLATSLVYLIVVVFLHNSGCCIPLTSSSSSSSSSSISSSSCPAAAPIAIIVSHNQSSCCPVEEAPISLELTFETGQLPANFLLYNYLTAEMLPEPHSPRQGLALSDLQASSSSLDNSGTVTHSPFSIGGGVISGLAISSHGSSSWSTRGVGGIGSGFSNINTSSSSSSFGLGGGLGGGFSCGSSSGNGGLNFSSNNQGFGGSSSSSSCCRNNNGPFADFSSTAGVDSHLPSCDAIPKLLCCTERVLEKCLAGCVEYVSDKCPHKLHKFDRIQAPSSGPATATPQTSERRRAQSKQVEPVKADEDSDLVLTVPPPHKSNVKSKLPRPLSPTGDRPRQFADLPAVEGAGPPAGGDSTPPVEGFIEQPEPLPPSRTSSSFSAASRSGGDFDQLSSKYPITEVSDKDLGQECGTLQSQPPFAPCLSRRSVDELFLSCCQQHVPSNCHTLCSYEHREHVAAETMIAAIQQDGCSLKWMSSILYCANQNRDNRKCCTHLSLNGEELGVGDRCLRMCNVARSGQSLNTVEQNDLVCLSNWNVIMYCARAGLRTIN